MAFCYRTGRTGGGGYGTGKGRGPGEDTGRGQGVRRGTRQGDVRGNGPVRPPVTKSLRRRTEGEEWVEVSVYPLRPDHLRRTLS